MSDTTTIEWCDRTWSPWEGCTKVGPGCDHCYAEARNQRFTRGANWGAGAPRRPTADWTKPLLWNRQAARAGVRYKVFPSLCDPFDNEVDPRWRADLFELIAKTPNLDWLLLTKRIGNASSMINAAMMSLLSRNVPHSVVDGWPWKNVWLGATIVNQAEADRDIPKLLATPAALRFLSLEPLLGPVDLTKPRAFGLHGFGSFERGVDWVIAGGESGAGARPMHPDWPRALRDQCADAGVSYLFKQWGEWAPGSGDFGAGRFATAAVAADGRTVESGYDAASYPKGASSADGWAMVHRAGKKAAGRLLDGVEHIGFPRSAA